MVSSKRLSITILEPMLSLWLYFKQRASKATQRLPKSNLANKPKQLLTTISNKTFNMRHKKKSTCKDHNDEDYDFGDGGLWQKSIIMGDKCEPLDFSGVIYYDNDGKPVSEPPMKSPAKANPLPNYVLNKKDE
ncbi:hypothetical protein Leryth_006131 [Lithospermum erythrorhizon]|nr:hypothetical protein Leryth_006131 [Lithospermum erythrorhizon]